MMYAPTKVTTDEQQTAGIMMVILIHNNIHNFLILIVFLQGFFLSFGIFCATNFAVLLSFLIIPTTD